MSSRTILDADLPAAAADAPSQGPANDAGTDSDTDASTDSDGGFAFKAVMER